MNWNGKGKRNTQAIAHLYRLVLIGLILMGGVTARAQRGERALLWEIKSASTSSPSYLFGTYHLLNNEYLAEVPRVQEVFDQAAGVVVETELDSSRIFEMMARMTMQGKKLADLVPSEDYELIAQEVRQTLGASLDQLSLFKPAFISTMLTAVYNQKINGAVLERYKGLPLDVYFVTAGKQQQKQIHKLETLEQQIDLLFDHFPVEEQARQLVEMIRARDEVLKSHKEMIDLYLSEDLRGLHKMYRKYSRQFGSMDYLLDDRNTAWMKQLPDIIDAGNQFIAVGAMHLTGPGGLVRLLRKAGYQVRPVSSSP